MIVKYGEQFKTLYRLMLRKIGLVFLMHLVTRHVKSYISNFLTVLGVHTNTNTKVY